MEVPSTSSHRAVGWRDDGTPAGRTWAAMLDLTLQIWDEFQDRAQRFDLTAPQAKALLHVHGSQGLTVGELAARLRYDPSSVTYICERLERRGLLERRPGERDRRQRALWLTGSGQKLADRLLDALVPPPPALARLTPADANTVAELLPPLLT